LITLNWEATVKPVASVMRPYPARPGLEQMIHHLRAVKSLPWNRYCCI